MDPFNKALGVLREQYTTSWDGEDEAFRKAFKAALLALISTDFPDYIHEAVELKHPWMKLLEGADYIDGKPPEVITKAYIRIIATSMPGDI